MIRGAEVLATALAESGVERVFSLSGNQIMPVYDALIDVGVDIVHTRHEAAAVHMADAHARISGQPAVALVTAGPGRGRRFLRAGLGAPDGQAGRGRAG